MQTEKAFQKQEGVFLNSKKLQAKKTSTGVRFYKKIGLGKCRASQIGNAPLATQSVSHSAGFKTPQTAIEGSYVDHKCPFTGNVSIRGRIFK